MELSMPKTSVRVSVPGMWMAIGAVAVIAGVVIAAWVVYNWSLPTVPPIVVRIARPDFSHPAELSGLTKLLSVEQQEKVQRQGVSLIVQCVAPIAETLSVLWSETLVPPDSDPSLDKGRVAFSEGEAKFAEASRRCNEVRIQKTIVFVDRTRPGIDDAVREQVRSRLANDRAIGAAITNRNGVDISFHLLTTSIFGDRPLSVSVPPPIETDTAEMFALKVRGQIDDQLASLLRKPMGEAGSALATTISSVFREELPKPGTHAMIFSDFIESDKNTIELEARALASPALLSNPEFRKQVAAALEKILQVPPLTGVNIDLYLLPVPSELARMSAMSEIFADLFRRKGATVEIHTGG